MRASKQELKYYIGIGISILLHSLQTLSYNSDLKFDIYFLYDYPNGRYLTNILYDISVLYDSIILTYWLSRYRRNIFQPLFIISIASAIFYFLFYRQSTSLILIPLYLWLAKRQKTSIKQ